MTWNGKKIDVRFIYALYSPQFPLRVKWGIAGDVKQRQQQLSYELSQAKGKKVTVKKAIALPSLFSTVQESKIHGWLRPLSAEMPDHAGFTEWFWHMNFFTSAFACWLAFHYGYNPTWPHFATLAIGSAWFFPADAALLVLVVFLWELRWYICAVLAACFFLL